MPAALKRSIKQLLGAYFTITVRYLDIFFILCLSEDAVDMDEAMPLKDSDESSHPESSKHQTSQVHTTGTGKTASMKQSSKHSEAMHTEL